MLLTLIEQQLARGFEYFGYDAAAREYLWRRIAMTERPMTVGKIEQLTTAAKPCLDALPSLIATDRAVVDTPRCRLCEKPQPCPKHGRTPITDADHDELISFVSDQIEITVNIP